jgi:ribose transport system permease protein
MLERPAHRVDVAPSALTVGRSASALEFLRRHGRQLGLPLVVAVLIAFFATASDVFFSIPNFRNIGVAAAALAAVSFGQTFTILTAGLDLSVGSTVALASVIGAFAMRNHGVTAGVLAALAAGTAVGLANGLVITRFKVFPFIATLATLSIASGLALSLSGGVPVTGLPVAFTDLAYELMLGVPVPVVLAVLVLIVAYLILRYTRFGRRIYAVGGNEEAARLSGIGIDGVKLGAYALSGFCAGIGSIILTSRVGSGQPALGASLPLESMIGVAFGVLFVSILSNGLNLLNVSSYTQMMVIGGALILAVALDQAMLGERAGK